MPLQLSTYGTGALDETSLDNVRQIHTINASILFDPKRSDQLITNIYLSVPRDPTGASRIRPTALIVFLRQTFNDSGEQAADSTADGKKAIITRRHVFQHVNIFNKQ